MKDAWGAIVYISVRGKLPARLQAVQDGVTPAAKK